MKNIFHCKNTFTRLCLLAGLFSLGACSTTEIDEFRQDATEIQDHESVVILGRRHNNRYETEEDFVNCVGRVVSSGRDSVNVVPEREFIDALFPFFEPRTAPMRTQHLQQLMAQDIAAEKINDFGIEYIIWLDGLTTRSDSKGALGCGVSVGAAACFGFSTWVDDSNFEAEIWDMDTLSSVGSISTDANGQSYLPAIVIPIPLLARVEANACDGLGNSLKSFINGG